MTFSLNNTPNATDLISATQAPIQNNFLNIGASAGGGWAAVDHIAYGATNAGTHNQVTFFNATSPVPTPLTTTGVLYSVLDGSSRSQLFFKNSSTTFQLTGTSISANGYVWSGGILFQWGNVSFGSTGTNSITFPIPFPTQCFNLQCTSGSAGAVNTFINVNSSLSTTGATVYIGGSKNMYFFAIGN